MENKLPSMEAQEELYVPPKGGHKYQQKRYKHKTQHGDRTVAATSQVTGKNQKQTDDSAYSRLSRQKLGTVSKLASYHILCVMFTKIQIIFIIMMIFTIMHT